MRSQILRLVLAAALLAGLSACETRPQIAPELLAARSGLASAIASEPPGDYHVGRRYYKRDYKFWGYVRRPQQPWSTAKLVMLNEQQQLAPDRQAGRLGADHNVEYKLYGRFSGATVYEPASNGFYPEFVLQRAEVKDTAPPPIYRTAEAGDPTRRVIGQPF